MKIVTTILISLVTWFVVSSDKAYATNGSFPPPYEIEYFEEVGDEIHGYIMGGILVFVRSNQICRYWECDLYNWQTQQCTQGHWVEIPCDQSA